MIWREFPITEVFTVKNTHSILQEWVQPGGQYPYVTAAAGNNSIVDYVDYDESCLEEGNCICIGGKTMVVTYQPDDFVSNDSHNLALYIKDETGRNESAQLFMVSCLQKSLGKKYHWGDSISKKKIQSDVVSLPCNEDGDIDYGYMAERIAELEAERIAELEAYLIAAGLNDYELTEDDKEVLSLSPIRTLDEAGYYETSCVARREIGEFHVGELFSIETSKKKINAYEVQFGSGYPYVVRSGVNNGIRGRINAPAEWLNDGNTITFGQDTGTIYYQPEPYFTGDKIKVMRLLDHELNEHIALFLIAAMQKGFKGFKWGASSFDVNILKAVTIAVPITSDGKPDYAFMESYIRAQRKLAITDAVKLKDQIVAETAKIVA